MKIKIVYQKALKGLSWGLLLTGVLVPVCVFFLQDIQFTINLIYLHTYFLFVFMIIKLAKGDF